MSLDILVRSGWELPMEAMAPDENGHTIVSSWLRQALSRLRSNRLADASMPMTGSIDGAHTSTNKAWHASARYFTIVKEVTLCYLQICCRSRSKDAWVGSAWLNIVS